MEKNEILLPQKYASISKMEMSYTFGGGELTFQTTRSFLNKSYCIAQAKGIIRTYGWKNVTSDQLAREMYGHAQVYFNWPMIIQRIKVENESVRDHVKRIDLDNKVDPYQRLWDNIWNIF